MKRRNKGAMAPRSFAQRTPGKRKTHPSRAPHGRLRLDETLAACIRRIRASSCACRAPRRPLRLPNPAEQPRKTFAAGLFGVALPCTRKKTRKSARTSRALSTHERWCAPPPTHPDASSRSPTPNAAESCPATAPARPSSLLGQNTLPKRKVSRCSFPLLANIVVAGEASGEGRGPRAGGGERWRRPERHVRGAGAGAHVCVGAGPYQKRVAALQEPPAHARECVCFALSFPPAPHFFFLPPKSRVRSARPPPLAPMC
jgi:hypothetical protein